MNIYSVLIPYSNYMGKIFVLSKSKNSIEFDHFSWDDGDTSPDISGKCTKYPLQWTSPLLNKAVKIDGDAYILYTYQLPTPQFNSSQDERLYWHEFNRNDKILQWIIF